MHPNHQNNHNLQFGDVIMDDHEVAEEIANLNINGELFN